MSLQLSAKPDAKATPTPAETAARAALAGWRNWPGGQMALIGDTGSGRTTLARNFAAITGAMIIDGTNAYADVDPKRGLVIDNADMPPVGDALLTALNLRHRPLLLTGLAPPRCWPTMIRDLQSRLDAMPYVEIAPPCDLTLDLRLAAACRKRFIRLSATACAYLTSRMQRDYDAIDRLADAMAELYRNTDAKPNEITMAKQALSRL